MNTSEAARDGTRLRRNMTDEHSHDGWERRPATRRRAFRHEIPGGGRRSGALSIWARLGAQVLATDQLELLKERAREEGLNVEMFDD